MFRTIEDYPSYEISESGLVRNKNTGNYSKPRLHKSGYLTLNLYSIFSGVKETQYVHRLVAKAYIPNPDNLPCINHKDENKTNNCVDNLEWCTVEYNNEYYRARHSMDIPEELKGSTGSEYISGYKRPIVLIEDGKVVRRFESIAEACRETGRNKKTIYEGLHRKSSKWRYA